MGNTVIELKSLSRSYGYGEGTTYALKDFDLTVKRGEFIMIMGPSGCGKTTLLNIIGLLDRPNFGSYTLDNEPVARLSARKKAKLRSTKIGLIFQDFNLIPSLNVLDNVALPLTYSGKKSYKKRYLLSDQILRRFHLEKREYFLPFQLSGGQKQRVAIARSLVNKPEIILADEPTGNLDSRSAHIVMEELKSIHEEGNTIIMVTHNPSLTTYATRVIHMLDGRIDTDIKTVADSDLPQPVSIHFGHANLDRKSQEAPEETETEDLEIEITTEIKKDQKKSKPSKRKIKKLQKKAAKTKRKENS
ncbi:ABC transporter ATP-binding protein [Candidatus Saccharibacteria bacterium]|nr:ABC transporter ATP-binding protein [Candidatus Saccharibacteria bacterium]